MTAPTDLDKSHILAALVPILEHMTSDWDLDTDHPIGAETRLVADLDCESIDVVEFIMKVRQRFQRPDLPLGELFVTDGQNLDDPNLGQMVDFLYEVLSRPTGGAVAASTHQAPVMGS